MFNQHEKIENIEDIEPIEKFDHTSTQFDILISSGNSNPIHTVTNLKTADFNGIGKYYKQIAQRALHHL